MNISCIFFNHQICRQVFSSTVIGSNIMRTSSWESVYMDMHLLDHFIKNFVRAVSRRVIFPYDSWLMIWSNRFREIHVVYTHVAYRFRSWAYNQLKISWVYPFSSLCVFLQYFLWLPARYTSWVISEHIAGALNPKRVSS